MVCLLCGATRSDLRPAGRLGQHLPLSDTDYVGPQAYGSIRDPRPVLAVPHYMDMGGSNASPCTSKRMLRVEPSEIIYIAPALTDLYTSR